MILKKRNPLSTREIDIGLNKLLQLEIEDFMILYFLYSKCTSNEYPKKVVILSPVMILIFVINKKDFAFVVIYYFIFL